MSDTIVTQQSPRRGTRTRIRPPTFGEALRAIAYVVERPGNRSLPYPAMTYSRERFTGYDLNMLVDKVSEVLDWVRVMDDVLSITVKPWRDHGQVSVIGRVRGVVVDLWTSSRALRSVTDEVREITVAELESLASETTALAGTAVSS